MESLVGEHERLGEQARELQEIAEKYKKASEQAMSEVRSMRGDHSKLREQIEKLKDQLQRSDNEAREMR